MEFRRGIRFPEVGVHVAVRHLTCAKNLELRSSKEQ